MIKRILRRPYTIISSFSVDPLLLFNKWRGMPYFWANAINYARACKDRRFKISMSDLYYSSDDRFRTAGSAQGHYFLQDLWAARYIHDMNVTEHVDVGSRIDGFIGHILLFTKVMYVDIRPIETKLAGFTSVLGSVLEMPFEDNSVPTLSCLHVIEHIGLGRYGDPVNPLGYIEAAKELARVLKPGGKLLLGIPVGRERLCFDAHRVFDPQTIVDAFDELKLSSFALIDDAGHDIIEAAAFEEARRCGYGCGLFVFEK